MTSKLTKKELAWFDEVNAVLARCPSPKKFGFYTIGDPNVMVYDKRKEKEIERKLDDVDVKGVLTFLVNRADWQREDDIPIM